MIRRLVLLGSLCGVLLACPMLIVPGQDAPKTVPPAPATAQPVPPAEKKPEKATPAKSDKQPTQKPDAEESDYELYKLFIDTVDQVERNYVQEIDRRELIEAAIRGVVSKLDPYSNYISPHELGRFRASVESEFGGIGIQLAIDNNGLRIISPMYGTPAYRAGLLAGDRIVEIDGKKTDGMTQDEAIEKLKGEEGAPVTLTVIHPGKKTPEKITVVRERIHVDTVLGDHRKADGVWDFMLDPAKGIGYIRITVFSRDTPEQLKKALTKLRDEHMRGLILDLRFDPGGLLGSAIEICNLFITEGRIVSTKGRNSPERTWDAQPNGAFIGFPMVVLVNRYSASASEIVAACLQDHKRAVIIGERTWGKGSVQNVVELENGKSALKLTTASYQRPSGKNIHRFPNAKDNDEWGVFPDPGFEVKLDDEEMVKLVEERRARDIIKPAKNGQAAAAAAPTGKDAAGDAAKKNGKKPFVDRQLQAALQYLTAELAKAQ